MAFRCPSALAFKSTHQSHAARYTCCTEHFGRHKNQRPEKLRDTQSDTIAPPRATPSVPKHLQGASLRRAQAMLSKHLFYPPLAVTQGLEGEVVLLLTLDAGGQIRSLAIAKSSGHALLDDAALDAVRHIGALPGNPPQTLLPVTFRLQ